ncbi:hypothetical protein ACSBR2_003350 [Camellia fascicularis]
METKNKAARLERVRKSLYFSHKCYVEPEGLSVSLALWWTDEVIIDLRFKSKNLIRGVVSPPDRVYSCAVAFVYAPPQRGNHRGFGGQFKRMVSEIKYPLLCIGDFNEIRARGEKQGGMECRMSQLQFFVKLLSDCALMDLEFNGAPYTWSNNQLVRIIFARD